MCEKHEHPKSTAGEEISNCFSSHWEHTNTHSHRSLCSSSRQSCWETANSWLAPSQSQALLVFHTQVEKRSYPKTCNCHSLPKKKNLQDIFLFSLHHAYTPQILIWELSHCLGLKCSLSEGYLWPPLLHAFRIWIVSGYFWIDCIYTLHSDAFPMWL